MEIVTPSLVIFRKYFSQLFSVFFLVFLLEFYKLNITKRLCCVLQPSYWEAFDGDFQFQWQYLQLLKVWVPQFTASNLGQIYPCKTPYNLKSELLQQKALSNTPVL